jgi:hypothetical protein
MLFMAGRKPEVVEGLFDQGKIKNSRVKILYSTGELFEGTVTENKRHGKGSMTYKNGDVYDGEWVKDKRIGKGKLRLKEGGEILAQWIEDQTEGNAIFDDRYKNSF